MLIEAILDLLFDGSVEIAKNKKISRTKIKLVYIKH